MKRILLLGGTGFVGRHLCAALCRQGHAVTVATRRWTSAREVQVWPRVTVQQVNVSDDAALNALVGGHDVVVNLIAVLHGNGQRFEQLHVHLPARVAQACVQNGVHELIHISALGADPQGPSMYQRSKGMGEQTLQSLAKTNGLRLTLVRPSVIFGSDDHFINLFAKLQKWLPVMPLAGASARFQPIWVMDVAQAVAHLIQDVRLQGFTYELGGPQVLTLAKLVRHAGHWSGHPRPVLPVPMAIGWLQALWMEWAPGEPMMSRDNLASMRADNVLTGQCPGLPELGLGSGMSLEGVYPTQLP
jgi:NADH dehydrogenase